MKALKILRKVEELYELALPQRQTNLKREERIIKLLEKKLQKLMQDSEEIEVELTTDYMKLSAINVSMTRNVSITKQLSKTFDKGARATKTVP